MIVKTSTQSVTAIDRFVRVNWIFSSAVCANTAMLMAIFLFTTERAWSTSHKLPHDNQFDIQIESSATNEPVSSETNTINHCTPENTKKAVETGNTAKVVFVKGLVTVKTPGDSSFIAVKGSLIASGDVIHTKKDGFLSLSTANNRVVNVQPVSHFSLHKTDCMRRRGKTQYSIGTPYKLAAVRG